MTGPVKGGMKDLMKEGIIERLADGEVRCGVEGQTEMGRQKEEFTDEATRCLCARKVEKSEMTCCNVCKGWSPLGALV